MEMGWKIGAVLTILVLFGLAYNQAVAWLERSSFRRWVNTALLVVVGVTITLVGAIALIGWANALLVLACFAASGGPMFFGSYIRQVQEHHAEEAKIKEFLNDESKAGRVHDEC